MKEYLSRGRDGYTVLAHCPKLSDDDDGPILDVLILNHFEEVAKIMIFPDFMIPLNML